MEADLKKDLSTITTINETTLLKLFDKIIWCISDEVEQAIVNREDLLNIDIGIGILTINMSDNKEIKYKFTPSQRLNNTVVSTVVNERNDLTTALEESLVAKLTNTYKDFF